MNLPAISAKSLVSKKNFAIAVNKKNDIKYFTLDELRQILSPVYKEEDYISWFLCFLLARTGARISELLEVRVCDVNFSAKVIKLITLKRRDSISRYVPVQPDCIGIVGEWIARQSLTKEDKLFSFGRKMAHIRVKRLCQLANIDSDRAHPHTFRHTYAIVNLVQGVPVTVCQEWLGHANILNTLIYTRILAQHSKGFAEQVQW